MNRKSGRILGPFRIAFLYLGDVIGAGFASGRETWQYFGIFGKNAVSGIAIATFLFASMGVMTAYLAEKLDTADMGKIILPVRSELASDILGRVTAFIIYIALISMSAAGGSLLNQQLGLPVPVGGAIVVFLVIVTMLGDFERVSAVFTYVIPVLFLAVVDLVTVRRPEPHPYLSGQHPIFYINGDRLFFAVRIEQPQFAAVAAPLGDKQKSQPGGVIRDKAQRLPFAGYVVGFAGRPQFQAV